jgi:hypothetical protein
MIANVCYPLPGPGLTAQQQLQQHQEVHEASQQCTPPAPALTARSQGQ